ncbi:MAG: D-alanine--D-alanine ligase [Planctomycetaceae bacterium]
MLIGLTYDLRDEYLAAGYSEEETAEFDRADTIDSIESALNELGHQTVRIGNAKQLIHALAEGRQWDLVFNICEGLHGAGREAQVPAILEVFRIPVTFSDPCVMATCLDKGITKAIVSHAGLATPKYAVLQRLEQLVEVTRGMKFPLFAKPIAEGTGKGVSPASKVTDAVQLNDICRQLLERHRQPVLIEEFLPGREFTVGILGTGPDARVLGTLEIVLLNDAEPDVYSYVNKERCEDLVEYRLVRADGDEQVHAAEALALASWRELGCRDGGRIDLRCDAAGQPQFIEANPLAGLHPFHSDLPMLATAVGLPYAELLRAIVDSAAQRCAQPSAKAGR